MIETMAIILVVALLIVLFWYFTNNKGSVAEKKVNLVPETEPVSAVVENEIGEEEIIVEPMESDSPPIIETFITEPSYQQNRKDRRRLRRNYHETKFNSHKRNRFDDEDGLYS